MDDGALPTVLLPYQRAWIADQAPVKVWEKSRRIGATWCEAADAALDAAARSGTDWWYLGYNKDMALEFIEAAAGWAGRVARAAAAIEEVALADADRDLLAYRLRFASGHKIVALSSRPANLRGKQGVAIIDEAAFHDDLGGLLKAGLAFTLWGGRVHVISTHNGATSSFNELVTDVRAGRRPYSLHRTTLDDALADGLYHAICRARNMNDRAGGSEQGARQWSEAERASEAASCVRETESATRGQSEDAWRARIFADYGDDADEELLCIPNQSTAVFMPSTLIEARMNPAIPVVRFAMRPDFIERGEAALRKEADDFCRAELEPLTSRLDLALMSCFGEDFGRSGDLTVIWPMQIGGGAARANSDVARGRAALMRRTPFIVELRNVPFKQQEQILFYIADRLPRLIGGAMDARGNGQYLAETAQLRYGSRVAAVMLTQEWYRENMPRYKAAFEDGNLELPSDAELLADHRMLRMEKGVAKIPERRMRGEDGHNRHGDSAIAGALAWYASRGDHQEYAYTPVAAIARPASDDAAADDDDVSSGRDGYFTSRVRFARGSW